MEDEEVIVYFEKSEVMRARGKYEMTKKEKNKGGREEKRTNKVVMEKPDGD